ncbi:NUDIX hydrolase [Pollutibacter soli]|uniref:NUDIX hydrolase n=1 Tax=Pollutibacter soli TaxID=3034157 RepID=UPI0030134336
MQLLYQVDTIITYFYIRAKNNRDPGILLLFNNSAFMVSNGDMELRQALQNFASTAADIYLPGISIDTIIFGSHRGKLKILLLRFGDADTYSLPAGYIEKKEDIDDAAIRILHERTGLSKIFLEQFYVSGKSDRIPKQIFSEVFKNLNLTLPANNWFSQRFISVCYYALVDFEAAQIKTETIFSEIKWFDVKKLPPLLFDHHEIIKKALKRLQADLDHKLQESTLLPEPFTMAELQKLYEAVFQKKFVRTNFQRKLLATGRLERLEKKYSGKAHKAPYLYKFRKGGY